MTKRIIVAITGASGAIYSWTLLKNLVSLGVETHLLVSRSGGKVFEQELGITLGIDAQNIQSNLSKLLNVEGLLHCHDVNNPGAAVASGSFRNDGMVIVPCSMSMLAAIASGLASELIARSASVMLKERRPLIVVPREAPLNGIHIRNMLTVHESGAIVLPAMPGFYNQPKTIQDLADFMVGRVLDLLGLEHDTYKRWEGMDMRM